MQLKFWRRAYLLVFMVPHMVCAQETCTPLCAYLALSQQKECLDLCAKNLASGGQQACIAHCGISHMPPVFTSCKLLLGDDDGRNQFRIQDCYVAYNSNRAPKEQNKAIRGYNNCVKRCRITFPQSKNISHALSK